MVVVFISLCTGIIAATAAHNGFNYLKRLNFEKNIKGRVEAARIIHKRGLTGNLFFIADKMGEHLSRLKLPRLVLLAERIRTNLTALGKPWDTLQPYTFIGIQIQSVIAFIIVSVILLDIYNILILAVMAIIGFYLPLLLLQTKVNEKHKTIFRQLPDVLDLLSLMMEAGLDFNAVLNKIINSEKGPLIDELRRVQQEIKLGKSRTDAFKEMSERACYAPLTTVVNAFTLAFKTGESLVPTLKTLSEQFRVERMQLAEKMANEAPVKLLIPIVLFIFPTVFIILFGPIVLSFLNGGF
jgi:tight adherence protein C